MSVLHMTAQRDRKPRGKGKPKETKSPERQTPSRSQVLKAIREILGPRPSDDFSDWFDSWLESRGPKRSTKQSAQLNRQVERLQLSQSQLDSIKALIPRALSQEEETWLKTVIERAYNRSRVKLDAPAATILKALTSISGLLNEIIQWLSDPNMDGLELNRIIADVLAPIVANDLRHAAVVPDQGLMLFAGKKAPTYEELRVLLYQLAYLLSVVDRAKVFDRRSKQNRTLVQEHKMWFVWTLMHIWERLLGEEPKVHRVSSSGWSLKDTPFVVWAKIVGQTIRFPLSDHVIYKVNKKGVLTDTESFLQQVARRYSLK